MKNDMKHRKKDLKESHGSNTGSNAMNAGSHGNLPGEQDSIINNYWMKMEKSRGENIDVDTAWNSLMSRLEGEGLVEVPRKRRLGYATLLRVAAIALIVLGTAFTARYLVSEGIIFATEIEVASAGEKNVTVNLPDGSVAILNRDSHISYREKFGNRERRISFSGEAYFDIAHDATKPFIIDAGAATVRVLGTSFNVISSNDQEEVEVFVTTGKVLLSNTDGTREVTLEPGFVGKVNNLTSVSEMNHDRNYLAWNTEVLVYDNNSLEEVFSDLKKVYGISVVPRNSEILDLTVATTFNKNNPETIVRAICTTFNLNSEKVGDIYYLSR